jgi:dethiobiotin synthetase
LSPPSDGLLITGTDTGVGKTVIAAGICAWLAAAGRNPQPLKPVESGTDDNGGVPADAALLALCAGLVDGELPCVQHLPEPLAPVVAARRAGVELRIEAFDEAIAKLRASGRGPLVVEGVGGALVEVAPGTMVADLAARWQLPVLVVAGNRLGVLSHTLMTVETLQARGADVLGVVLNTLHGEAPGLAESNNAQELEATLPAGVPLLGVQGFVAADRRADPSAMAAAVAPWFGQVATLVADPRPPRS